jgi:phosphatidate phosphatase APP1
MGCSAGGDEGCGGESSVSTSTSRAKSHKKYFKIILQIVVIFLVLGVGVASLINHVVNVKIAGTAEGSLVFVDGQTGKKVSTTLTDSDSDGFADSGQISIQNRADFTFKGKIIDLTVEKDDKTFLSTISGNGIWYFYEDSDLSGNLSDGDILVGKVKIEQGSSNLDGDTFTVAANSEKELRIHLYFEPYAAEGNYEISFDIIAVYDVNSG